MKKTIIYVAALAAMFLAACCGQGKCEKCNCECDACKNCVEKQDPNAPADEATKNCVEKQDPNAPADEATIVDNEQYDLSKLKVDADGYYVLFDGTSLDGWRGYGQDAVPASWSIDDGCIRLVGSGTGEAQVEGGGDLLFAHKFKNFTFECEYKISKGGNSGIFYLAQEVKGKNGEYLPIWQSCSEYQVLDNANHEDAKQGIDGNRQAASLYDMIPAKPQNAKPFGEWNTVKIRVFKGSVWHYQNGEEVLEYHLWTPKWKEMLDGSKFKKGGEFPAAYDLMIDEGQKDGGYIAFQDHGDDVWYRNVRIKLDE